MGHKTVHLFLLIGTTSIPGHEHHMFGSANHETETALKEPDVTQLEKAPGANNQNGAP
jgi:hypothetical protein